MSWNFTLTGPALFCSRTAAKPSSVTWKNPLPHASTPYSSLLRTLSQPSNASVNPRDIFVFSPGWKNGAGPAPARPRTSITA